jgi:hypothetical protein
MESRQHNKLCHCLHINICSVATTSEGSGKVSGDTMPWLTINANRMSVAIDWHMQAHHRA